MKTVKIIRTAWDRFHEKYEPVPESGCWLWTACLYTRTGYGFFQLRAGARMGAHRASWILHNGPIPDGLLVCHKCDTRCCVNPGHIFLGSFSDNAWDMSRKGRHGKKKGAASPNARAVLRVCPVTGHEKRYGAIIDVRADGFKNASVSNACRGRTKTHGGFRWSYL